MRIEDRTRNRSNLWKHITKMKSNISLDCEACHTTSELETLILWKALIHYYEMKLELKCIVSPCLFHQVFLSKPTQNFCHSWTEKNKYIYIYTPTQRIPLTEGNPKAHIPDCRNNFYEQCNLGHQPVLVLQFSDLQKNNYVCHFILTTKP
jgi:nitrate/TMAO reductase-like tetraheme cytochrome c subunit